MPYHEDYDGERFKSVYKMFSELWPELNPEEILKPNYPSWACQNCGAAIGWIGRLYQFLRIPIHKCIGTYSIERFKKN